MMQRSVFTQYRTVSTGDTEVYVAEAGNGPPVLCLHGNPDTHLVWSGIARRLSERHRVIAPDLPGFGRSNAPRDFDVSLAGLSRWLLGLVDSLELDRVNLVIHDIGGSYGNAFATEHPDRVRTMTIFNTNFFPDYRWHFWGRVWRRRVLGEVAMALTARSLFVNQMRKGSPGITRKHASAVFDAFHRDARRMVLRFYRAADPERFRGWDERLLTATETIPKQVLWGELDPYLPAANAARFGGTVQRYPHAGHWPMIDEPSDVADRIAAHLV